MHQQKNGLGKACFVTGIISDILLILIDAVVFVLAALMVLIGPIAFIMGADYTDMFANELASLIVSFIAIAAAAAALAFNFISIKKPGRISEKKRNTFRLLAGILILPASLISISPVVYLKDGILGFLSFVLAAEVIIAIVHFALMIGAVRASGSQDEAEQNTNTGEV